MLVSNINWSDTDCKRTINVQSQGTYSATRQEQNCSHLIEFTHANPIVHKGGWQEMIALFLRPPWSFVVVCMRNHFGQYGCERVEASMFFVFAWTWNFFFNHLNYYFNKILLCNYLIKETLGEKGGWKEIIAFFLRLSRPFVVFCIRSHFGQYGSERVEASILFVFAWTQILF